MLLTIRDQLKGWVAVLVFGILIVPFAFWGVNYYFDQAGGVTAVEVNGEEITLAAYQRAYQNIRQQWQAMSGGPVPEESTPLLKKQAIDNLVQAELFRQTGEKIGLRVSDQDVWQTVQEISAFNDGNGFSPLLFEAAANQAGMTPAGFTAQIKQDMSAEQLRDALLETDFVIKSEADAFSGLKNQTRDISYVILSSDELKETIEVTDEQVNSYYEGAGRYMEPEKVKIAYLVLSLAKVAEEVYLEEGEPEVYFNENRQNYVVEETRKIKQIMLKLPEEPSQDALDEMRAKAEELHGLIKAGREFEEVAVENAGGYADSIEFSEFGFLTKGVLEPEVDEVVFTLNEGEISEPVQSRDGFHIMGVDEIKGAAAVTFASVRDEVEQDLRKSKGSRQLYELTDRLETLVYENPGTLEVASEELALEIQQSDFVSREAPGVGIIAEPGIISTAFSEEVLLQENNSDVIELDNDRYIVLRVLESRPTQKKPLESVRDEIITRIKYEQASARMKERGELILKKLNDGQSKETLASEFSLDWKEAEGVARDDENTNRAVLRAAFKAGRPAEGKPEFGGTPLGTGDYAVVIVHSVTKPNRETTEKEELDAIRSQLLQTASGATWTEFIKDLQTTADVEIYDEAF